MAEKPKVFEFSVRSFGSIHHDDIIYPEGISLPKGKIPVLYEFGHTAKDIIGEATLEMVDGNIRGTIEIAKNVPELVGYPALGGKITDWHWGKNGDSVARVIEGFRIESVGISASPIYTGLQPIIFKPTTESDD